MRLISVGGAVVGIDRDLRTLGGLVRAGEVSDRLRGPLGVEADRLDRPNVIWP